MACSTFICLIDLYDLLHLHHLCHIETDPYDYENVSLEVLQLNCGMTYHVITGYNCVFRSASEHNVNSVTRPYQHILLYKDLQNNLTNIR